jgi:hypothetical protein
LVGVAVAGEDEGFCDGGGEEDVCGGGFVDEGLAFFGGVVFHVGVHVV